MAQTPHQGGESADFVRRIVTDPKNVPDVMRLYGYPGASSEEGHDRLYLSPDLTNYVEIPKGSILHRIPVPAEQDPHGAVTLWVNRDAQLIYKMAPGAQALAHYFAGAIQGGGAVGGAGMAAGGAPLPPSPVCTFPAAACPPPTPLCPTHIHSCAPCLTPACTHLPPCTPACPTHIHSCAPCLTPACTHLPPCTPACPTHIHSCAPCLTPACTHLPPCTVACTHLGPNCTPGCPFPTEVTCVPVCHVTAVQPCVASPAPACGGPLVSVQCDSVACGPGGPVVQPAMAGAQPVLTQPLVCQHTGPLVCLHTAVVVCQPSLFIVCHPTLPIQCHNTLQPVCQVTLPIVCRVTLPPACFPTPPITVACGGSIACGVGD
jgi:hypothetical protein